MGVAPTHFPGQVEKAGRVTAIGAVAGNGISDL
jgi:hypothetical protein